MARSWWRVLVVAAMLAGVVGCGGRAEKNRNSDLDRPKPAEKK